MRVAVAIGVLLLLAGCNGSPKSSPPPPDNDAPAQTATNKPKPNPGKGNPARIFAPDRDGLPYYQVKEDIEAELREKCGNGKLCVKIVLKQDSKQRPDDEDCVFHRAEPKEVNAGGTFTFYLSNLDCEPPPSPTE